MESARKTAKTLQASVAERCILEFWVLAYKGGSSRLRVLENVLNYRLHSIFWHFSTEKLEIDVRIEYHHINNSQIISGGCWK